VLKWVSGAHRTKVDPAPWRINGITLRPGTMPWCQGALLVSTTSRTVWSGPRWRNFTNNVQPAALNGACVDPAG
jgi:hypothetical protein